MHSCSILIAALAAAASLASAQEERPRIYFPRHVKRQFVNATITRQTPHPPADSTLLSRTTTDTTKRDTTFADFFPTIPGLSQPPSSSSSGDSGGTTVVVVTTTVNAPPASTPGGTGDGTASTGGVPDTVIQPTTKPDEPSTSSAPPTTPTLTSSSGILLAPTGIVSSTKSSLDALGPISSLLSSIVSQVSSAILPPQNTTEPTTTPTPSPTEPIVTRPPPTTTSDPIPAVTTTAQSSISISISLPPLVDPTTTSGPNITSSIPITSEPPITTPPPPPPPETSTSSVSTISEPPITSSNSTSSIPPSPTDPSPPITSSSIPPVTIPPPVETQNSTALGNSTAPPTDLPPSPPTTTSLLPTTSTSDSKPWIPSTIVVEPSATGPSSDEATTKPTTIPSGLPRAITPNDGLEPIPDNMVEIQIAFNRPLNYQFVATTPKSAAQLLQTLPDVLKYLGPDYRGPEIQSVVRRLQPLNTISALGYTTTLAICTYPKDRVDKLRVEMNLGTSWMWRNPNPLPFNMSQEINTAIDILLGSTLDSPGGGAPGSPTPAPPAGPNDVFNNGGSGNDPTPSQRGATAGIAVGAIFISAAYGGAMFIIARRYKKKKQAHRRSSSLANSSEMRQTGSPALMGGALLSRDFTSNYGGVAGPRDSHGSGRSNMNNSGRTAYISAPVAAENSLGWN